MTKKAPLADRQWALHHPA